MGLLCSRKTVRVVWVVGRWKKRGTKVEKRESRRVTIYYRPILPIHIHSHTLDWSFKPAKRSNQSKEKKWGIRMKENG